MIVYGFLIFVIKPVSNFIEFLSPKWSRRTIGYKKPAKQVKNQTRTPCAFQILSFLYEKNSSFSTTLLTFNFIKATLLLIAFPESAFLHKYIFCRIANCTFSFYPTFVIILYPFFKTQTTLNAKSILF